MLVCWFVAGCGGGGDAGIVAMPAHHTTRTLVRTTYTPHVLLLLRPPPLTVFSQCTRCALPRGVRRGEERAGQRAGQGDDGGEQQKVIGCGQESTTEQGGGFSYNTSNRALMKRGLV